MFNLRKSIGNIFSKAFQMPFLKYHFTMSPSPKDIKILNIKPPSLPKDELYFHHENESVDGGIQMVCENLKKNPSTFISSKGACKLIYNIAVKNLYEPEIFQLCERDLNKNMNKLEARLIFGGLYGSLKTNAASPYLMDFFLTEYERVKENITSKELYELLIACSFNTSLMKENLFYFVNKNLKPNVLKDANEFKISYKKSIDLMKSMVKMEYHDQELWSAFSKKLEYRIRFKNLLIIQEFYDSLLKSKAAGNPLDITKILTKLENKLNSRVDFRWRYDVKANKFYTFQELKAKRDDYNFKNQSMNLRAKYQKFLFNKFSKETDAASYTIAKKRKMILEKELETLTFERFIKDKKLEEKGLTDEKIRDYEDDEAEKLEVLLFKEQQVKKAEESQKRYDIEKELYEKKLAEEKSNNVVSEKEDDDDDASYEEEKKEKKQKTEEKLAKIQEDYKEKKMKEKAKMKKGKRKADGKFMRDNDDQE